MIEEARQFEENSKVAPPLLGATTRLSRLPTWKAEADLLFMQVGFSLEQLLEWRQSVDFAGPVFAGVTAPPSAAMARKLRADIPELALPKDLISALDLDRDASVDFAFDMVNAVRESGVFDGVHLRPRNLRARPYRPVTDHRSANEQAYSCSSSTQASDLTRLTGY